MSIISSVLLLLLLSFLITFAWAPVLIDFLYTYGLRRQDESHRGKVYRFLQKEKVGMPSMGGILIIITTLILSLVFLPLTPSIQVLILTMVLFALLGGADDLKKLIFVVEKFWGLRRRHIFLIQWSFAFIVGYFLYSLGFDAVGNPFPIGPEVFELGLLYIVYAAVILVATSNAFNITDGVDGLSSGLLIISLVPFLILALTIGNVPVASFIAIWLGSLFVYLYFNIHPARFMMGDVGAQPFGAMLAVVSLLLGHSLLLPIIGAVFYIEAGSSFIQMLSYRFRNGKRVLTIAPLHHHFQVKRWSDGKICQRFWLFGAMFAILGLMIAFLTM